MIVKPL